jgi:hypothetical protein
MPILSTIKISVFTTSKVTTLHSKTPVSTILLWPIALFMVTGADDRGETLPADAGLKIRPRANWAGFLDCVTADICSNKSSPCVSDELILP